jgi:hypothetical protein
MDATEVSHALSLVGGAGGALKAVLGIAPQPGRRRRGRGRERKNAYLNFQRSALAASAWAALVNSLASEMSTANRRERDQCRAALLRVADDACGVVTDVLATLAEVRMVGNPAVRSCAEEITALLSQLLVNAGGVRPARHHQWVLRRYDRNPTAAEVVQRVPMAAQRLESVRQAEQAWQENQTAELLQHVLGLAHRDFTIAARSDLGLGSRWWQRGKKARRYRWQLWRMPGWPGGWPSADAAEIVDRYRSELTTADQVGRPELDSMG